MVFETAAQVYGQMKPTWKGDRGFLLAQVVRLVEKYWKDGILRFSPPLFAEDEVRRRLVYVLNMTKIVQHIMQAIDDNTESLVPIFDSERPIQSTGDMQAWFTRTGTTTTSRRGRTSTCVYDFKLETTR